MLLFLFSLPVSNEPDPSVAASAVFWGRIFGCLAVSTVVMVLLGSLWLCCTGRATNTNRSPTGRCQMDRLGRASEEMASSWATEDGDCLTGVARESCDLIGEDCRASQPSADRSREL
jgi:hypothetical protein